MKQIIIFPYPADLPSGEVNPKTFPYWKQFVEIANKEGYEVIQVSPLTALKIEGVKIVTGFLPSEAIINLVRKSEFYVTVDSFAQHLLNPFISGYVIWAFSDPAIFGYRNNVNIIKSDKYLRKEQFKNWESIPNYEEAYFKAEEVWDIIKKHPL